MVKRPEAKRTEARRTARKPGEPDSPRQDGAQGATDHGESDHGEPGHTTTGHAATGHGKSDHAEPRHAEPRHAEPGHAEPGHAATSQGAAPASGRGPGRLRERVGGALGPTAEEDAAKTGHLAGQFLIAMPSMGDPRFARSLVYVCLHSAEGALGIIVNQPFEGLSFEALLRQLNIEPLPPGRSIRMHRGGPVEAGRGFVLHSADWVQDSSLRVSRAVALTASAEILKEIAQGRGPERGILALGYAGWGPGQLDREIQENAWLSAPADASLLFDGGLQTKWQRALAKIGVDPALLSGAAGHA